MPARCRNNKCSSKRDNKRRCDESCAYASQPVFPRQVRVCSTDDVVSPLAPPGMRGNAPAGQLRGFMLSHYAFPALPRWATLCRPTGFGFPNTLASQRFRGRLHCVAPGGAWLCLTRCSRANSARPKCVRFFGFQTCSKKRPDPGNSRFLVAQKHRAA